MAVNLPLTSFMFHLLSPTAFRVHSTYVLAVHMVMYSPGLLIPWVWHSFPRAKTIFPSEAVLHLDPRLLFWRQQGKSGLKAEHNTPTLDEVWREAARFLHWEGRCWTGGCRVISDSILSGSSTKCLILGIRVPLFLYQGPKFNIGDWSNLCIHSASSDTLRSKSWASF